MVRVTLLKLKLNAVSVRQAHTTINVSFQDVMGSSSLFPSASLPEQPQMNGGKERNENLNASHLCPSENAGLPKQDRYLRLCPVWQRSHHSTQCACCNGMGSQRNWPLTRDKYVRNDETLQTWGKGDSPTTKRAKRLRDNECYQNVP
jgi:hypothetical protein